MKDSSQMCCGTSPFTMAWYSIKSSSKMFNNSGHSINCQFMVSKDSSVHWTESNEEVLLRSKSTKACNFEDENPPVVTNLNNISRLLKKCSGTINNLSKSSWEIYYFQRVASLFAWWECQFQGRCQLFDFANKYPVLQRFLFVFYLLDNLRLDESCC